LKADNGSPFERIYLVDIWMGNDSVASFYKNLVKNNINKTEYYYTDYGANNSSARDYIASSVILKKRNTNHLKTNIDAVESINKNYLI
jgi:hypothetical protein